MDETIVTFDKQLERRLHKALEYARFKERGLSSNPFNIEFAGDVWQIKVGRDEELITGVENLKEMSDKNTKMINILGTHGSGKTIYEILLHSLANRYNTQLGFERILLIRSSSEFKQGFVDVSFVERGEGQLVQVSPPLLEELKRTTKQVLIFIDDADIIFQDYPKAFTDVAHLPNVFIVAAWNKSAWERAKHMTDTKFPSVEVIMLSKLSDKECAEIIKKRIARFKFNKRADNLFSESAIETLAKFANGSPHRIIRLAKRLLDYIMAKDIISIGTGAELDEFLASIEDIKYETLIRKMASLTNAQRKILEAMKNLVEADAKRIGDMMGITRVGAMKQLKELEKMGIIHATTKAKKRIYQLREEIEYGTEE